MRFCSVCKIEKPLHFFNKAKNGKSGFNAMCKACAAQKKKEYRKNNPEVEKISSARYREKNRQKLRQNSANWRASNKDKKLAQVNRRRALRRNNAFEPYTIEDVLKKYGNVCHICSGEIDLTAPRKVGTVGWEKGLHLEHVIPISMKGPDTIENVKPAHGKCNLIKSKQHKTTE